MNAVAMVWRCKPAGPPSLEVEALLSKEGLIDRPLEADDSERYPVDLYVGDYWPLDPVVLPVPE